MKHLFLLFATIFIVSCGNDNNNPTPEFVTENYHLEDSQVHIIYSNPPNPSSDTFSNYYISRNISILRSNSKVIYEGDTFKNDIGTGPVDKYYRIMHGLSYRAIDLRSQDSIKITSYWRQGMNLQIHTYRTTLGKKTN